MQDFFYYSMIRSKDENTTKTRKLDGSVPLDELPYLMRAMGYYPTDQEVQNMNKTDSSTRNNIRAKFVLMLQTPLDMNKQKGDKVSTFSLLAKRN